MTTEKKVARRKLSLLDLASELGNVSKACRIVGYSRQQFYEIRRNYQTYGADGLIDRLPGARSPHPNRVPEAVETAVLEHALAHPCHGPMRVAHELALKGVQVCSGGVRGGWSRHGVLTKTGRLLRLEKSTAERRIELSEERAQRLERCLRPATTPATRNQGVHHTTGGHLIFVPMHPATMRQTYPTKKAAFTGRLP